jgi:hypothetical protein
MDTAGIVGEGALKMTSWMPLGGVLTPAEVVLSRVVVTTAEWLSGLRTVLSVSRVNLKRHNAFQSCSLCRLERSFQASTQNDKCESFRRSAFDEKK